MGSERVQKGLTTEEAFDKLFYVLEQKLQAHYASVGKNWREILRSSMSTRSRHTTITWSSLLILFVESIIIFTLYTSNYSHMWSNLLPEGIVMLFILFINLAIVVWENYKRVNELPVKLEKMINQLREITTEIAWDEKNYPDLFMPISPCITLQWCYRDGKLVNLPWALLVNGDIVVLQPAQKVVADCILVNEPEKVLRAGDIYSPPSFASESRRNSSTENKKHPPPRLHPPLPKSEAEVITAPYLEMVDLCLLKFQTRPPSFYNKERHTVVTRIIECIILPLAIMSFVALCLVRMFYLPHWLGIRVAPWADIILLQPIASTFPLIPVALPGLWTLMQCIGNSRLWKGLQFWGFEEVIESPGKGEKVILNRRRQQCRTLMDHWHRIREFFLGREETLHRSQKVLHVLASVTALCCVDKKGILSWPNPTADKLFFFRTIPGQQTEEASHGQPTTNSEEPKPRRKSSSSLPSVPVTTVGEVLDITIDNNNELHFDDTHWENHMPNLKPLGLNILLNTCNHHTQAAYSSFHSHISHELISKKNNTNNSHGLVVPVTSRRCLCEVAKMIGFADKATTAFSLEQELCSFRHIESDQVSRDKLTKAKIKFPFPHLMSIVVKERASQSLQLLAQGTGDIILDVCEDFWDGKDLRPMTDYERKLISDFYQRSSLSSVCTAFAYKPISSTVNPSIASLYMELPASKGLRYFPYNTFSHLRDIDFDKIQDFLGFQDPQDSYISTDCLINDGNKNNPSEISDVQGYLQMQTGQIFLGMVTMQYQACMDIVQLIEQLDQGCIRFVHFSKENELRSRIFSEKMGLESGWNCHISLTARAEEVYDSNETTEQMEESASGTLIGNSSKPDSQGNPPKCKNNRLGQKRSSYPKNAGSLNCEEATLLPRCSSSVPEMVLLSRSRGDDSVEDVSKTEASSLSGLPTVQEVNISESATFGFSSDEDEPSTIKVRFEENNLETGQNAKNQTQKRPLSAMDSVSSAILSPDSFQEVYELVEQPTPLGFDMSNRAQLPVGIENIRPHLESVDNVPLLVSLFTDCNGDNICEMISIMQDYGEVTLLLGSVCNIDNKGLFLQADASVAVEPMYPQCCQRTPAFLEPANGNPSPTDLAMMLTSLPCSLSLKRKDCSVFYDLIAQTRHFMNKCVRNSIQFWICCNIAVTVLGLVILLMLLPPLYSLSDTIWLSCIIIPILTVGLAFSIMSRVDISVMNSPSWKNQMVIDKQMVMYAFWCYGMKFIPSVLNITCMAAFNLRWICENLPNVTCSYVYPIMPNVQPSGELKPPPAMVQLNPDIPAPLRPTQCISTWSCENFSRLLYVQQFSVFFLVLYFVVISACFVYRSKYLWIRNPAANKVWVITSLSVLLLQFLYSVIKVSSTNSPGFDLIPAVSYAWGFVWAPIVLAINELIRRHEIKVNIRYEKRARLDFGTKLGMNSPF